MDDNSRAADKYLEEIREEAANASKGQLKIFFGYAAGVGKTYAMLEAAHEASRQGTDVVAGYIEPHARPKTAALLAGLEVLPPLEVPYHSMVLQEFDLDAALQRKPQLLLVDELAHTNARGCRHSKRYQDIKELLQAGINVYTTLNVQHIESLNDMVTDITGITVRERIPDYVFDQADQVELVDLEPQELLDRFKAGEVYQGDQVGRALENFFTLENLTALREISLRRCADRMNILTEQARIKSQASYHTDEHILVCLSSSPSNPKIIRTAARMAKAFRASFTALFVESGNFNLLNTEDKKRLRSNIHLAEQLGATVETAYGDDIARQIAEFARLSGASKIVIGRSIATRKKLWGEPSLTEKLIELEPNIEIHVIPDLSPRSHSNYFKQPKRKGDNTVISFTDIVISAAILTGVSGLGLLFQYWDFAEANIITVYVLGVLLISVLTSGRLSSLLSSVASVLIFNFLFTEPKFSLQAYDKGYPVTFFIMFTAASLTGSLATRLKNQAKQSARAAYRTKILFDTNQLLQQAGNREEIVSATSKQLLKLLNRSVIFYMEDDGDLGVPYIFSTEEETLNLKDIAEQEKGIAEWVKKNNKHAGAATDTLSGAKCLYMAVRLNERVYGVVGIVIGEQGLDAFENSILLSILGECALALENEKNAYEKEEAAALARNEQIRANLLRAISHDLRTPLTSISGNASNLISNGAFFDEATKHQLYMDIYDGSMWLINLVENLLAVSKIEEGQLSLHLSEDLIDDVIEEALKHVNRKGVEHLISVEKEEEFLLARMDARLIVQVIINIVDNAIKYTPQGSHIVVKTRRQDDLVFVSIADDGKGISDEMKPKVFDMFYTGENKIADSRRSLGLGLALCRSIINIHGGKIWVSDNQPTGTIFTFTLPAGEGNIHE